MHLPGGAHLERTNGSQAGLDALETIVSGSLESAAAIDALYSFYRPDQIIWDGLPIVNVVGLCHDIYNTYAAWRVAAASLAAAQALGTTSGRSHATKTRIMAWPLSW